MVTGILIYTSSFASQEYMKVATLYDYVAEASLKKKNQNS